MDILSTDSLSLESIRMY